MVETLKNVLKGIRRTIGVALAQKTAAQTSDIQAVVDATDAG